MKNLQVNGSILRPFDILVKKEFTGTQSPVVIYTGKIGINDKGVVGVLLYDTEQKGCGCMQISLVNELYVKYWAGDIYSKADLKAMGYPDAWVDTAEELHVKYRKYQQAFNGDIGDVKNIVLN